MTDSRTDARLAAHGWNADFARGFSSHLAQGRVPARVVAEHRGRYVVADGEGERPATLSGRLRHHVRAREHLPAVGDWVALGADGDGGAAAIHAVLPRRGAFLRKAAGETTEAQVLAANVDLALIATALPADLSERRIERYLALAWESGAVPVVVLTKADLADDAEAAVRAVRGVAPGVDVAAVSSVTGAGMDALARWLRPGRTAVLLGSSGVGKSTLANRLMGGEGMRTGAVRGDGKGRHHHAPPSPAAGERRPADRHAGDARAAAVDCGHRPGRRLRGRGGAGRSLPLRRLPAQRGAGMRRARGGGIGGAGPGAAGELAPAAARAGVAGHPPGRGRRRAGKGPRAHHPPCPAGPLSAQVRVMGGCGSSARASSRG
ncbi:MAG TPA: GTPase RsgA [Longimicrobium sp.]